jgi:hypothetical protein
MALVGRRMLSTYVKVVVFTVAWAFNALARGIHVLAQQMLLGRALMIWFLRTASSPLLRLSSHNIWSRELILCTSAAMAETKQHVQMQSFTDPRGDGSPVNEGPSLKQGTVADQLDMQRLGKTQQTKVLLNMRYSQGSRSDWTTAQLSLPHDLWLYNGPNGNLGGTVQRIAVCHTQWRKSWRYLGVPGSLFWISDCHRIHGGNVKHVTHHRRSIP